MYRLILVDDHDLIREALAELLMKHERLELVGKASNGPEALDIVRRCDTDLVLLDLSLPGRGGLDTLKELKARARPPKVLILTGHEEDELAVRCMKAGADGYVTKWSGFDELLRAIDKIREGGKYVSPALAEQIALSFDPVTPKQRHSELTDRELEVMCRIAKGQSASEIADDLYLSVKTVASTRSRILRKTGLRNTPEIICYAVEHHLVS